MQLHRNMAMQQHVSIHRACRRSMVDIDNPHFPARSYCWWCQTHSVDMVGETSRTWARMILSMLADQPYLEVTTTQGVLARRVLIFTFSTSGSAKAVFHQVTVSLNCSCSKSMQRLLQHCIPHQIVNTHFD